MKGYIRFLRWRDQDINWEEEGDGAIEGADRELG